MAKKVKIHKVKINPIFFVVVVVFFVIVSIAAIVISNTEPQVQVSDNEDTLPTKEEIAEAKKYEAGYGTIKVLDGDSLTFENKEGTFTLKLVSDSEIRKGEEYSTITKQELKVGDEAQVAYSIEKKEIKNIWVK